VKENIRCHQFAISSVANIILAPAVLRKGASLVSLLLATWIMSSLTMHFNNSWPASLKSLWGVFVELLLQWKSN